MAAAGTPRRIIDGGLDRFPSPAGYGRPPRTRRVVRPTPEVVFMRRAFAVAVLTLSVVACKKTQAPPSAPSAAQAPAAAAPASSGAQILRGKVLEKVDVSQYSYLRLGTQSGEVWAAVNRTDKKV